MTKIDIYSPTLPEIFIYVGLHISMSYASKQTGSFYLGKHVGLRFYSLCTDVVRSYVHFLSFILLCILCLPCFFYTPVNIESDLRPNAVTNSLTKIAEKFVSRHFNEYFDEFTDDNQFGCVRNRSTIHMHELFLASDSSQNIIRVLFVDFTKAFDVTDHNVLFNKFVNCGMP